jgi:hypothetical protein
MRDLWLSLHASFRFGIASFHVRLRLTLVQGTLNKNTKPATGLCHERAGPLMARKVIALSSTVVNSHQMMTALRCCAIWYVRPWGDTFTSTTVVVNRMTTPKSYISTREWSRIPTKTKTGSHTAFTGVVRVSSSHDLSRYFFSQVFSQVLKVPETKIARSIFNV